MAENEPPAAILHHPNPEVRRFGLTVWEMGNHGLDFSDKALAVLTKHFSGYKPSNAEGKEVLRSIRATLRSVLSTLSLSGNAEPEFRGYLVDKIALLDLLQGAVDITPEGGDYRDCMAPGAWEAAYAKVARHCPSWTPPPPPDRPAAFNALASFKAEMYAIQSRVLDECSQRTTKAKESALLLWDFCGHFRRAMVAHLAIISEIRRRKPACGEVPSTFDLRAVKSNEAAIREHSAEIVKSFRAGIAVLVSACSILGRPAPESTGAVLSDVDRIQAVLDGTLEGKDVEMLTAALFGNPAPSAVDLTKSEEGLRKVLEGIHAFQSGLAAILPMKVALPEGDGTVPPSERPALRRDHFWLSLKTEKKLGPAKIRDYWDRMSDEERKRIAPRAWEKVGGNDPKTRKSGRETVKRGLRVAKSEVKKGRGPKSIPGIPGPIPDS